MKYVFPFLLVATPVTAETIPSFYFFGDSSMDSGNSAIIQGDGAAERAPFYCPEDRCRLSNGPMWIEQLGIDVVPILSGELAQGLDFSVAGARMDRTGSPVLPIDTGVSAQLDWLETLIAESTLVPNSKDIAFVQAGANDFLDRLDVDEIDDIIFDVVTSATENVQRISDAGIKRILFSDVLPIDYAEYFAGEENVELRMQLRTIIDATNHAIREELAVVEATTDGLDIVNVDWSYLADTIFGDPGAYGFLVNDNGCYDSSTGSLCSTNPEVQNTHILWDELHLTTAFQHFEADFFATHLFDAFGVDMPTDWRASGFTTDIAAVPLPATAWLIMFSYLGLVSLRAIKRA